MGAPFPSEPGSDVRVIAMAGTHPGRRHKGPRHTQSVRFPIDHAEVYRQRARAAGLELSDYVARVMAEAHGLDLPDYLRPADQGVLPLAS